MTDLKTGILLWSQAASWTEMTDAAQRVDRLGYDHLWTWDHLYAIFGDPYQDFFEGYTALAGWAPQTTNTKLGLLVGANTFRNPGIVAKSITTIDHISGGRAILGHRRRVDGDRASGPRHRLRLGLRPAPRLARRVDRRAARAARRPDRDLRAGRPLRVRRAGPSPDAGPGPPADHDRRQRREEDPADRRQVRRHVERDGPARPDGPQGRGAQGALRRRRPRHRRHRVHARHQVHDPRLEGRGRPRLARGDGPQPDADGQRRGRLRRSGTARRRSSPTGCARTWSSASGRSSRSNPRRTTSRRSSASSARSSRSSTRGSGRAAGGRPDRE